MPAFTEEHISKHTVEELYSLVVDIESYPEFLPWCSGASVVEREDKKIIADLDISFAIFHESYRSCVNLVPPADGKAVVDVSLVSGPFKRLENHWRFEEFEGGAKMHFYVDFEEENYSGFYLAIPRRVAFTTATPVRVDEAGRRRNSIG